MKGWCAAAIALAALAAGPAAAANGGDEAYNRFDAAWQKVTSYTCTLTAHEVQGTKVQDRVYQMYFRKPVDTRMNVVSGDDRGAEAAYQGGDHVKGHHGGFLSFIHLNLNIHNSQATSIRGTTIADANFQALVDHIRSLKTSSTDVTIENGLTKLTVNVADPSTDDSVTREAMTFGDDGMPVEFDQWEGDNLVKQQTFADIKLNVAIPDSEFNL